MVEVIHEEPCFHGHGSPYCLFPEKEENNRSENANAASAAPYLFRSSFRRVRQSGFFFARLLMSFMPVLTNDVELLPDSELDDVMARRAAMFSPTVGAYL